MPAQRGQRSQDGTATRIAVHHHRLRCIEHRAVHRDDGAARLYFAPPRDRGPSGSPGGCDTMIPDRDPTDAELVAILRSDAAWLGSYGVEDPVIAGHVARAADRIEALAAEKRVERLEEKLTAME